MLVATMLPWPLCSLYRRLGTVCFSLGYGVGDGFVSGSQCGMAMAVLIERDSAGPACFSAFIN